MFSIVLGDPMPQAAPHVLDEADTDRLRGYMPNLSIWSDWPTPQKSRIELSVSQAREFQDGLISTLNTVTLKTEPYHVHTHIGKNYEAVLFKRLIEYLETALSGSGPERFTRPLGKHFPQLAGVGDCDVCGNFTINEGTCFKCPNCGNAMDNAGGFPAPKEAAESERRPITPEDRLKATAELLDLHTRILLAFGRYADAGKEPSTNYFVTLVGAWSTELDKKMNPADKTTKPYFDDKVAAKAYIDETITSMRHMYGLFPVST